jgi:hypothetical protein
MRSIIVIRGILTFFDSLGRKIDTIDSLGVDMDNKVVIY